MINLTGFSYQSHQGPHLNINEDHITVDSENKLYFLLDGFGGGSIGVEAIELVKKTVSKFFTNIYADPEMTLPLFYNPKYTLEGNALINAVKLAHRELINRNADREMSDRGGVNGIFIAESENMATIVSVGNCKSYYFRDNKLSPLTLSDSFENRFAEEKLYFPLVSLGLFEELSLNIKEFFPREKDQLVFLSQGAYFNMSSKKIETLLSAHVEANSFINDVFHFANQAGNLQNQSMLVLNY